MPPRIFQTEQEPLFIQANSTPQFTGPTIPERILQHNANKQKEFEQGAAKIGIHPAILGAAVGATEPLSKAPRLFKGFKDLTTKSLEKLKGRSTVSKQFISDLTNQPDLKQAERDLVRRIAADEPDVVDVPSFANKVKSELLPLERRGMEDFNPKLDEARENFHPDGGGNPLWENVVLKDGLRGPVANYSEHVYESPIETSAGKHHFYNANSEPQNYFAHTRIEEMAPNYMPGKGKVERTIELQSDLFQKGRLEGEKRHGTKLADPIGQLNREDEVAKLEPYRNTWQERIIREDIKDAAKRGVNTKLYPTGETAMKIEGLGESKNWYTGSYSRTARRDTQPLKPETLKVGQEVNDSSTDWIITDILGDGKFKAVQKSKLESESGTESEIIEEFAESFDISGKVDTNNPIYRFYEKDVGRYLSNKYGAKRVKDAQGVEWYELSVKPDQAKMPIEAFAAAPLLAPEVDRKDEPQGRIFKTRPQPLFINTNGRN